MDDIKLKSFCAVQKVITKLKRQHKEWEKKCASCTSDKGLTTRIYRELKKLNFQRINNTMNKWENELNK
jgi:hypothetical protein